MMHFGCTICGRCCQGLRLPLSAVEAIDWIDHGGVVEILCDAGPDVDATDSTAEYRRARAFSGCSGAMPIQVSLLLTASFSGPCPNLQSDFTCRRYEARPAACRIYPAEINPARRLDPAEKLCPPDAWSQDHPLWLDQEGLPGSAALSVALNRSRSSAIEDAPVKARLAVLLDIDRVALANEGFVIFRLDQHRLRDALVEAMRKPAAATEIAWRFMTNRDATAALIRSSGALAEPSTSDDEVEYLPFFPADAA